jgi:hypothetical protein
MKKPTHRKLRGYAFDPSLSNQLDTFQINEITYKIPWEELDYDHGVLSGEYLEIIDYDPSEDRFYESVKLDDPNILAENGLDPSESNPMFHQQMVYAVAMTTIKNFEKALGRKILWSNRRLDYDPSNNKYEYAQYVEKLRIYPHALRESNAYYSPQKVALLFGYFHSNPSDQKEQMPGSLIFTCLCHDIIAHEVTHAILDGMNKNYNIPTNPDVLAFHEAFADIIALFQHFTYSDVLKHQIAHTRGDLSSKNLLGELAQQFGVAIGKYGSLRDAIGEINPVTGKWQPKKPNPLEYLKTESPHERGSILVSAVFEAFLSIYNLRVKDLYRIASNGTGILPKGELNPDLINRLAREASKTAEHILNICIRAIDYCPPIDITFGEYLRALITADYDVVKEDRLGYRLAFIEAFKRRGIFPKGINSLSIESLLYPEIRIASSDSELMKIIAGFLRDYNNNVAYIRDRELIYRITESTISGKIDEKIKEVKSFKGKRKLLGLHERFKIKFTNSDDFIKSTGLAFHTDFGRFGFRKSDTYPETLSFQIQNLRLVSRVGPNGEKVNQVIFTLMQRCGVYIKDGRIIDYFTPNAIGDIPDTNDTSKTPFQYKGGCTFILDLDTQEIKYLILKPLLKSISANKIILNENEIIKQFQYVEKVNFNVKNYFDSGFESYFIEPFSILHQPEN